MDRYGDVVHACSLRLVVEKYGVEASEGLRKTQYSSLLSGTGRVHECMCDTDLWAHIVIYGYFLAVFVGRRLLGADPGLWERRIYDFEKRRALAHIAPLIPTR